MFQKKSSEVHFVDENLKKAFEELKNSKSEDRQLYEWLSRAFKDIKQNVFCGIQVPKKLIPQEYVKKYGIKTLF